MPSKQENIFFMFICFVKINFQTLSAPKFVPLSEYLIPRKKHDSILRQKFNKEIF